MHGSTWCIAACHEDVDLSGAEKEIIYEKVYSFQNAKKASLRMCMDCSSAAGSLQDCTGIASNLSTLDMGDNMLTGRCAIMKSYAYCSPVCKPCILLTTHTQQLSSG